MKAIHITDSTLLWQDTADPKPQSGEVIIEVTASAVNRADLMQRSGKYPPPPGASPILGLECSGRIIEVASDVDPGWLGREVCALLAGGGYAERVAVPVVQVLPIPDGISLVHAAAIPEVFATAWLNLKLEGQLQPGEQVLLHAAASGVGTAALQLCKAWGNPTFATVGDGYEHVVRMRKHLAEAGLDGLRDFECRQAFLVRIGCDDDFHDGGAPGAGMSASGTSRKETSVARQA